MSRSLFKNLPMFLALLVLCTAISPAQAAGSDMFATQSEKLDKDLQDFTSRFYPDQIRRGGIARFTSANAMASSLQHAMEQGRPQQASLLIFNNLSLVEKNINSELAIHAVAILLESNEWQTASRLLALAQQPGDVGLALSRLFPQRVVRDLEAPHGRAGGLLVGRRFFSQFAPDLCDLGAGLFHLPREPEPFGIAAVRRFRRVLDPILEQGVQRRLFVHVLEVILLTPTAEDPTGHRPGGQVLAAGQDRRLASVGTANLDNRSFRLNFEISMVFADRAFAAEVAAMLEKDFERCRAVSADDLHRRSFWFRLAVRFARLLSPVQ